MFAKRFKWMRVTRTDYYKLQVIEHKLFVSFKPSHRICVSFFFFSVFLSFSRSLVRSFVRSNGTIFVVSVSFPLFHLSTLLQQSENTISHNGSHLDDVQKIHMFIHNMNNVQSVSQLFATSKCSIRQHLFTHYLHSKLFPSVELLPNQNDNSNILRTRLPIFSSPSVGCCKKS